MTLALVIINIQKCTLLPILRLKYETYIDTVIRVEIVNYSE
jgi:hypothetical protein